MMQPVVFDPAGLRVGQGYDVHAFAEGRKLILGGVDIPHVRGLLGHSDADVLAHAISDALLGGIRGGDIGKLFPDTDPAYKDADSLKPLSDVPPVRDARGVIVELMGVFGIDVEAASASCAAGGYPPEVVGLAADIAGYEGADAAEAVDALLAARADARAAKDWSRADAVRDGLCGLGFVIEDTPQGARVTYEG